GQLTVSNSTFFGNSGGDHPSDLFDVGTSTLDSVTMASFYGFSDNTTTFRNSILLSCNAFGGAIQDDGHNLVQTPGPCISAFTGPGTILNQDPMLGPLADNGGPTQTRALLAGSPAIDAGDTTLTTDQRGVARPQGAADDIGAFEVSAPLRFTIEAPTIQTSQVACPAP
ncbi:MAG: hypothetical protein KDH08_24380, partial [Anaerolineae bacterium]|nr:hypothetical protein [Anaerolineae bacterium]